MAVYYDNFSVSGDPQAKFKNVQQDDKYIKFDLYFSRYCYESESDIPSNVAIAYVVTTWSVWFNGTGEGTKNATSRIEHGVSPGESEKGELVVRFRAKQYVNGSYLQTLDFGDFKSSSITVKMEEDVVKPEKWSWYSSNGTASSEETEKAHTAITSGGKTTDFSSDVWDDMVDKVSEIRQFYKHSSWNNTYATKSDTKVASDKILTAKMFNSLLENISQYYNNGMSTVIPGQDVQGSYFTTLTKLMNGWIDNGDS